MKSFALDENGDLLIENGQIQMVHDTELTKQKIKTVLGTQKGEWFLDWQHGINQNALLKKQMPEDEEIMSVLQDGVTQVDENLVVNEIKKDYNKQTRKLNVSFVARDETTGETIDITYRG